MGELMRNISQQALHKSNLTVELDFAKISRIMRNLGRPCNKRAFHKKTKLKKSVTDIILQFQNFFKHFPNKLVSSNVSSIKEVKKMDFPIGSYKLSYMPETK